MIVGGFWKTWWAIAFLASPFLLMIVSFLLSLYIAHRHLNAIVDALQHCRYIVRRADLLHQGWFGRQMLLAIIGGMVQWPGPGLRKGEMDAGDLDNFPAHLRKVLDINHNLTIVVVLWTLFVYCLIKLR